jgi:hypothetical protein
MRVGLNSLNQIKDSRDKILLIDVNQCYDGNKEKNETQYEIERNNSSLKEDLLPDQLEKVGNKFILSSSQTDNQLPESPKNEDLEIFCCNLTSANKSEHTIILHVDYWRKQANKVKLQS